MATRKAFAAIANSPATVEAAVSTAPRACAPRYPFDDAQIGTNK
jgi:hypothetical protein